MAAQFKVRKFFGGFLGAAFLYLLLGCEKDGLVVNAQAADVAGKLYLDRKESDVRKIAANATLANGNCDSLNGCSSACSRVTCQPIIGGSHQCAIVANNEFWSLCPAGACSNKMLFDYDRSFVILPAPASLNLGTEIARDICLQRTLDSTFKTVSIPSEYAEVYFGSTSGAFRDFPGREQNTTLCTSFDPRRRPWYLNGISVSKDVKIFVDVANSMGSVATVDYKRLPQNTYLDVAKNLTLALLETFSPQDYVEIFSFDSSNTTSLGGAVQIGASYNYLNPAGRPELAALGASVNQLTASPLAASSNLNKAVVQAVNSFTTVNKLKVILVLSDGHFAPLNSTIFPSAALQSQQVKLMVYKLPTNDDSADPFLLKTPSLRENICNVSGSFERLSAPETANPLYSMRSYFTFLARAQLASVGNNATWSNPYSSISQDRTAITVTYPAFGSDGLLIGVAGIDVVIENLNQTLQVLVYAEFQSRTRGTQAPANIPMNCSYQISLASSVCSSSTPPDSSAICVKNDTSTLAARTCCGYGTCGLGTEASGNHGLAKKYQILIGALVAVATVAICFGIWGCVQRRQRGWDPPSPPPGEPVDPHDPHDPHGPHDQQPQDLVDPHDRQPQDLVDPHDRHGR